jgi:hypothetical protein
MTFEQVVEKLEAKTPEEIFGTGTLAAVRRQWLKMCHVVHPDKFSTGTPAEVEAASKATATLNAMWKVAQDRFSAGIYGKVDALHTGPTIIKTRKHTFSLGSKIHSGGTAGIFLADRISAKGEHLKVVMKIPNSPADNDLIRLESDCLTKILKKIEDSVGSEKDKDVVRTLFPPFLGTIKAGEREANVFAAQDGWYSLAQIKEKHPDLDPRIAVFILNRILMSLSVAGHAKIHHGSLSPNHVLVHAVSHRVQLIDWTLSGEKMGYRDPKLDPFTAPEVLASRKASTAGDIYSAAMCFVYLVGNHSELEVPSSLDQKLLAYLNRCLQPLVKSRFRNPDVAYESFRETCRSVFGEPRFVHLSM